MSHRLAAALVVGAGQFAARGRRSLADERGQGTVEYAGLAMAIGVLLLAVGSFLGGKDHGIGSVVIGAVKDAVERASGGGK
jgi:Flp pilus assembly pilin Flp